MTEKYIATIGSSIYFVKYAYYASKTSFSVSCLNL